MHHHYHYNTQRRLFSRLGIRADLAVLIKEGRLHEEIEKSYQLYREASAALDDWEIRNPDAAKLTPWYEAREKWKVEGRKEPEWYEVLTLFEDRRPPIRSFELVENCYKLGLRQDERAKVRREVRRQLGLSWTGRMPKAVEEELRKRKLL